MLINIIDNTLAIYYIIIHRLLINHLLPRLTIYCTHMWSRRVLPLFETSIQEINRHWAAVAPVKSWDINETWRQMRQIKQIGLGWMRLHCNDISSTNMCMYTCVYIYIIRIRMNKYMSNIQNIASRKHVRRFRMTPSGKLTIAILNGYILQLAMSHGYKKRKL